MPGYFSAMKKDMQIIGIKKYAHGYTGCVETIDRYEFFHFARGKYKTVQQYRKVDFRGRGHFIDVMRKFVHAGFFKHPPIAVSAISPEEFERALPM